MLPQDIVELITSPHFVDACKQSFTELDLDGNGVLTYDELRPVLQEMLSHEFEGHHVKVTDGDCKRLMDVTDTDGNGVLSLDEWMDFAKYVAAYTLIEAEAHYHNEALPSPEEPSVEAVLQVLREDRIQLYQDLGVVDWLRNLFDQSDFKNQLRQKFRSVNVAGSPASAAKLIPVIVALGQGRSLQVTRHHCEELLRVFDDGLPRNPDRVMSLKEYTEFTEFTFIVTCLLHKHQAPSKAATSSEPELSGRAASEAESALLNADRQIQGMKNEMTWLSQQLDDNAPEIQAEMQLDLSGTDMSQAPGPEEMRTMVQDMRHLQLDLDFSNRKVEELKKEKRELLDAQTKLQAQLRSLQQRSEETEQKLQHQELELLDMQSMVNDSTMQSSQMASTDHSQILEETSSLEGVPRGLEKMSRAQAITALQLLHHELHKERKAREKAEKNGQKCMERLHRLMGTVERQRDDMSTMEKRCRAMESMAGDRERRLQEGLMQADSLRSLLRNLSEEPAAGFAATGPLRKPQRGPGGPLKGSMTRNRSAPHNLPSVQKR